MIRSLANWIKQFCYAVLFLALLACLMEIGLRVYDSATGQLTRHELYDRGMTCKSWVVHHELKPSRAYLVRNPDSDQKVRVTVNSFGLRGREPVVPKPAGTLRILCLGDDMTFSPHVIEVDTFSAQLQAQLCDDRSANVEVWNAGVPDSCPLLSFLQLRHRLLGLAPDLVILNFDMSDVADDHTFRWFTISDSAGNPTSCSHPALDLPRGMTKPGTLDTLLLPQWLRQQANSFLADQASRVATSSIDFPRSRYLWLGEIPPDWEDSIQQSFEPLAQIRDLLAGQEIQLLVTVIPAPWQVAADATAGGGVRERLGVSAEAVFRSRRPFELLDEYCRRQGIEFHDVSPAFQSSADGGQLYLKTVAELSPEGHALHAAELARYLAKEWTGPRVLPRRAPGDYAGEMERGESSRR